VAQIKCGFMAGLWPWSRSTNNLFEIAQKLEHKSHKTNLVEKIWPFKIKIFGTTSLPNLAKGTPNGQLGTRMYSVRLTPS